MRGQTRAALFTRHLVRLAVVGALLCPLPSCGGGTTGGPAPVPGTTLAPTTTTTTTTTSTTTTTTTTTTQPPASYANVHPLWAARGCTACHVPPNRLVLNAASASVCTTIRNGTDAGGGQYLDNPTCSANGSSVIRVSATGLLANNMGHPGGVDACFAAGGSCREPILAWCAAAAGC